MGGWPRTMVEIPQNAVFYSFLFYYFLSSTGRRTVALCALHICFKDFLNRALHWTLSLLCRSCPLQLCSSHQDEPLVLMVCHQTFTNISGHVLGGISTKCYLWMINYCQRRGIWLFWKLPSRTIVGEDRLMAMAAAELVEWYQIHQKHGFMPFKFSQVLQKCMRRHL